MFENVISDLVSIWLDTIKTACEFNGLSEDVLISMPLHERPYEKLYDLKSNHIIHKGFMKIENENPKNAIRELIYKKLVLARMSQTDDKYKFEAFDCRNAIAQLKEIEESEKLNSM